MVVAGAVCMLHDVWGGDMIALVAPSIALCRLLDACTAVPHVMPIICTTVVAQVMKIVWEAFCSRLMQTISSISLCIMVL